MNLRQSSLLVPQQNCSPDGCNEPSYTVKYGRDPHDQTQHGQFLQVWLLLGCFSNVHQDPGIPKVDGETSSSVEGLVTLHYRVDERHQDYQGVGEDHTEDRSELSVKSSPLGRQRITDSKVSGDTKEGGDNDRQVNRDSTQLEKHSLHNTYTSQLGEQARLEGHESHVDRVVERGDQVRGCQELEETPGDGRFVETLVGETDEVEEGRREEESNESYPDQVG